MNSKQPPTQLSTRHTKVLAEYFPGEPITKRLVNWLYLLLVWREKKHQLPISRNVLTYPQILISDLKDGGILPEMVKDSRYGGMFEKHHFKWFEESELFYYTFICSIHEQNLAFTTPLPLNAGPTETCIMCFDGITGDRDTKNLFLLNAKKRWIEFKPVIKTINWTRNGNIDKNIESIISAFDQTGEFKPYVGMNFEIPDQYISFMVYMFKLGISEATAKRLSTHAKKTIYQSTPRKTKEKSQVNVSICNSTIENLNKLCKSKKISKANLITELINNYSAYGKQIDFAIHQKKTEIQEKQFTNFLDIQQPISREQPEKIKISLRRSESEEKARKLITFRKKRFVITGKSDQTKSIPPDGGDSSNE